MEENPTQVTRNTVGGRPARPGIPDRFKRASPVRPVALTLAGVILIGLWALIVASANLLRMPGLGSKALGNRIVHNLRVIDLVKTQWAADNRKVTGDTPTAMELAPYFNGGVFPPAICGERYLIHPMGRAPSAILSRGILDSPAGSEITLPER